MFRFLAIRKLQCAPAATTIAAGSESWSKPVYTVPTPTGYSAVERGAAAVRARQSADYDDVSTITTAGTGSTDPAVSGNNALKT